MDTNLCHVLSNIFDIQSGLVNPNLIGFTKSAFNWTKRLPLQVIELFGKEIKLNNDGAAGITY